MDTETAVMALVTLIEMTCVIVVVTYLLMRTHAFERIVLGRSTLMDRVVMVLTFGILSIYGTYSGITVDTSPINIRDIGPMMAGLIGGPLVGLGAGLLSGTYRYMMGGVTALPCGLATVLAGLLGGLIWMYLSGRFIGVRGAVVFAIGVETLHMGIVLLLVQPLDLAWDIVRQVALPMIATNAMGVAIISVMVGNYIHEKSTERERDEYQDELERKRVELSIAREIQRSFLPMGVPDISGYDIAAANIPAAEVGGDFYDFIRLPGGQLALVIADVSGKGVPAALYMALSRTVLRANALGSSDPVEVMQATNAIIAEDSESGMFVTMFYAQVDTDSRVTTFVNAGHNPPIIIHSDGAQGRLDTQGIALGAMEDIELESGSIVLVPGDMLAFYTDGVTEAIDPAGEEYGEERLIGCLGQNRHLPAKQIVDAVHADVVRHCGTEPQFDDITLMVMNVREDD